MGTASTADVDVLVVGAGPVGLTATHELARRGVRVRLVDRAEGPAVTSRATATHARTLEIYHQMGVLGRLLPRGRRVENFTMHSGGRRLIRFGTDYTTLPTRFPFTLQVDQVITEEVLRDLVREFCVEPEWGVELKNLTPHADRAEVTLRHADGDLEQLDVAWLIGADGGHSTVRDQLGLELVGDSCETWLIADAVVDVDLPRDSLHWMHIGDGTILLVPFPDPGKWRLLDTADVDQADAPDVVAARFAAKITKATGCPAKVATPSWISVFTIQQRMIRRMRAGRCFVAGDAAHVHSPASGQGLNTGIQDAHNLAWKLADVVRDLADEELLDSYSAERVPIGEALLGSTKTATGLVALRNKAAPVLLPLGLGLLNVLKPIKRKAERKMMSVMSGLALHYPDGTLGVPVRTGRSEQVDGVTAGHRVGCSVETEQVSAGWQEMCVELTDPRWTLLADIETGDQRTAAEHVTGNHAAAISVRVVTDEAESIGRSDPRPLADPGGRLRADLGIGSGDYALIRPDGYLADKGRLIDIDQVDALLRRFHFAPVEHTENRAESRR